VKKFIPALFITVLLGQQGLWQPGTAYTLPEGRWEYGLFQPVRWGQSENRDISFYKLSSLLMPNVTLKQRWLKKGEWTISSTHALYYPTPLLKRLQSPLGMEIGGPNMFALISPEFEIPPMVALWNMAIFSKPLYNEQIFTGKAGFALAFGGNDLALESTIDLPLVYHRLAVLYNGWLLRFGVDLNGRMKKNVTYLVDSDLFLIPGMKGNLAFEHKGMLTWERSPRFQVSLGYKMVYGIYPDGYPNENIARIHILPLVDLQWARD
jgi:hypothetical protein|tara:strand:- start:577 stop:1371 length:795 start_codon:yes stop_codon:yes gene_type:complete